MEQTPVHYHEYLQLDKILNAQQPESSGPGQEPAHDEMLFIITHQAYELWFKQIQYELDTVLHTMRKPALNDNSAELQTVVHRLQRIVTILKVLVHQISIIETMTPMDFLDFRDMLRPASGFQSWQFKTLEAKLGLTFDQRHGHEYYTSQLNEKETAVIKEAEQQQSLIVLVNGWLSRMPFITDGSLTAKYQPATGDGAADFFTAYEHVYVNSLTSAEKNNGQLFKDIFYEEENKTSRQLSAKACRSALFIMLYRGYPMLELPFQLLEALVEIDNQLGNWRHRHINMVRRMIGTRIGTGGSSGAGYLAAAMEKHYIFKEIAQLNSFLINRRKLPLLANELTDKLGYSS